MTGAKARIPPAFAAVEIGDRRKWVCAGPIGGPVSNLEFPISGICPCALPRYRFAIRAPVSLASRRRTPAELTDYGLWVGDTCIGSSKPSCFSWSAQVSGRLRASLVTVRSAGARPSAMASMTRGER
jgi:hypothetical protein